ncbi:MAG TPA: metal ABC transporter permease [Bellilinea sp.]|nr:metal ABC transporter permease [Bellilinea sp.]
MSLFQYGFVQNAVVISILIAFLCPLIGMFLVLRRNSLIGDTLAHSSLAGVALSLLTNTNPIVGAFVFTSFAGILIEALRKYFRRHADLVLSIVLALSVGIAITVISSGNLKASPDSFLFGSILTVTRADVLFVSGLTLVSAVVIYKIFHQLVYISFDEEIARIASVRVTWLNYAFSILVSATIAMALRIVGVLVLSTLITIPVATAMQLGHGLKRTIWYAIGISLLDILLGLFLSFAFNVATGGMTALVSVGVLLIVILYKRLFAAGNRPQTVVCE